MDLGDRLHTYDGKGQKTSIESPYFSQKCTYDTLGNVTESIFANQSHSLAYDDLSQLTQDNSDTFGYDSHYNRLSKNTESAEINSLDEMTSQGQVAYAYDLNGNQTLKKSPTEVVSYEYDALNRLIETSSENTRVQYIYDPLDRRLAKILPDKEEHYFYLGNIELGMISSGVIEELAIPGPIRKGMTEPIAIELKDKVFIPMIDIQHNVRHLVDPAQRASVRTYDYNAFGESSFQKEELFNPWRYGSKRLDLETHLLYFGKRYYDPSQGRWISCDPIGSIDSTNLYQFVLNNPLRYYDPDGRFVFVIPLLVIGGDVLFKTLVYSAATAIAIEVGNELGRSFTRYLNRQAIEKAERAAANRVKDYARDKIKEVFSGDDEEKKDEGKNVDPKLPSNPDDITKGSDDWKETTHPEAGKAGHREFKNTKTGETIRFDKGDPGAPGHRGKDHYHRPNPNATGRRDAYLDKDGQPVPHGHEDSHLYPPG